MYKKLEIKLSEQDISAINNAEINPDYVSDHLIHYHFCNSGDIEGIICKYIQFKIDADSVRLTKIKYPGVTPHVDGRHCALNFYLIAGEAELQFYKTDICYDKLHTVQQSEAKNLILLDTIITHSGECYLINTKIIHAIKMPKS